MIQLFIYRVKQNTTLQSLVLTGVLQSNVSHCDKSVYSIENL
jgi:hypothetical protein